MWETLSMPQKGLQFRLMMPTTFPVGLQVASAAVSFSYTNKSTPADELLNLLHLKGELIKT